MKRCTIAGCGRLHNAHGLCATHYSRLRRYGSVRADEPVGSSHRGVPRPASVPITHDCPRCEDGGLVVPYDADERGQIKTYRCVVRGCWAIVREMVNA